MNNNKQPALLSVTQLHKTYASRDGLVTAIDHISLEVQAGETVAATVLLPQPDSPTSATVSPACTSKLMWSMAVTRPSRLA